MSGCVFAESSHQLRPLKVSRSNSLMERLESSRSPLPPTTDGCNFSSVKNRDRERSHVSSLFPPSEACDWNEETTVVSAAIVNLIYNACLLMQIHWFVSSCVTGVPCATVACPQIHIRVWNTKFCTLRTFSLWIWSYSEPVSANNIRPKQ